MRRIIFSVLLLCAGIFCLQQQPRALTSAQIMILFSGSGNQSCAQANAFLNRTSGLSLKESAAYQAMICGMVSDGDWGKLDALYIFATNTAATAALNLVNTNFSITVHGTPTFTADQGYSGGSTLNYLDTTYTPSTASGNLTLNNAAIGAYDTTSRSITSAFCSMGGGNSAGTEFDYLCPLYNDGDTHFGFNSGSTSVFPASANAQGMWIGTVTSSTVASISKNGSFVANVTQTTTALANQSEIVLARRNGSGVITDASTDGHSAALIASGAINVANVSNRINGYMKALGINVY